MSSISVRTGKNSYVEINQVAIECPYCHSKTIPNYLCFDNYKIFASCPNSDCSKHFVLSRDGSGHYTKIEPNAIPQSKEFSEIVRETSPSFTGIYNQAFHAEQMKLNHICGVGYRKALEFLIKDYLISRESDEQAKENIKKKLQGNCIKDDVKNENIKNVAKRAVWLGNDETHYTRVWADKDVNNLKQLIELTVRWIENEIETERVIREMSSVN